MRALIRRLFRIDYATLDARLPIELALDLKAEVQSLSMELLLFCSHCHRRNMIYRRDGHLCPVRDCKNTESVILRCSKRIRGDFPFQADVEVFLHVPDRAVPDLGHFFLQVQKAVARCWSWRRVIRGS